MNLRRADILAMLLPTALAALVAVMVGRLYVEPIVLNDTSAYVSSATWYHTMIGYRTPFYGWLIVAGKAWNMPMLAVRVQIASWLLCIAAFAWLVLHLSRCAARTLAAGVLLVAIETAMMCMLPAQWQLVTDPLYADWVTLGILLMLIATESRCTRILVVGAAFVGLSSLLRPALAGNIIAGLILIAAWRRMPSLKRGSVSVTAAALIVFPVILLSALNRMTVGSFSLSPVIGLHLITYELALTQPGDMVFRDPGLNRAFHETVETKRVPGRYRSWEVYFLPLRHPWQPLSELYASMAPATDAPTKRYQVNAISTDIAKTLILLHPVRYLRLVAAKTVGVIVPNRRQRNDYFWHPNPFDFYAQMHYDWQSDAGAQWQLGRTLPDPYSADLRIGRWLDAERLGLRLSEKVGPATLALLILVAIVMFAEAARRLRSQDERLRMLGIAIVILAANTLAQAVVTALVTLYDDPRYTLPGLMTGEAAVLLTLVSLTLPVPKRD